MAGQTFVIEGLSGKKLLKGTIPVMGSKNAVLPVMAAAALIEGESTFENVPGISDIDAMSRILEGMGAFVSRNGNELTVNARQLSGSVIEEGSAKSLRASVLLSGPILARTGTVSFPHPGGDLIGERPIDLFLAGFTKLGASVTLSGETYTVSAPNGLTGGEIFFRTVSVTATETLMAAATLAKGTVVLKNAAMEPEVIATADYLKSCGAKIEGAGTPTIVVSPVTLTEPPPFRVIPDRIEAASFLCLGALLSEELTITDLVPQHLDAVMDILSEMGATFSVAKSSITVRSPEKLKAVRVRTHEYPGFATDAQPPMMILLTQANGESIVIESIFDGRLAYTEELVKMGADVKLLSPHKARVMGPTPLKADSITSPDIRAGLSYVFAAAVADGTSKVGNAHLIDRGYESIEHRLSAIGLSITRQ